MQRIVPSLWFDKEAEEAMNFYVAALNAMPKMKKIVIADIEKVFEHGWLPSLAH